MAVRGTREKVIPMANDKIAEVGVNIAEKATMIWNVADMLRGRLGPMSTAWSSCP